MAFNNFANRILWKYHFQPLDTGLAIDQDIIDNDELDVFDHKLQVKKESIAPCNFVPDDHALRHTLRDIKQELSNYMTENPTHFKRCNVIKAISNIKESNPNIIFKPADKNLGLVAMDILQYDKMVMEHLSNTNNYRLEASDTFAINALHSRLVTRFKNFKSDTIWYKSEQRMINNNYSFTWPKFHVLPKIHKSGPLKGRPIAGQVNWITTPVSKILDRRLQKCSHLHHSTNFNCILKNSQELVHDLETINQSDLINNTDIHILTADIESLYPNIDLEKLYKIIDKIDPTLTPLTRFVCDNSYITYNGKIYKQLNGIPMGTNAAVTLANLYVGFQIDKYITERRQVKYFKRYIDDLFWLYVGSKDEYIEFQRRVAIILGIPLTFDDYNTTIGIFLDLSISRCPYTNKFNTCIYQKPLNKYNYITPLSNHAPHMFSGFIKGELTRYARLSTDPFAYNHTKALFFQRLIARGYQRRYLNRIFKKHTWFNRFNDNSPSGLQILPFVLPFTLRNHVNKIQSIIKSKQDDISLWFPLGKVLYAHAKRPSLYNRLCPSAITKKHMDIISRSRNPPSRKRLRETTVRLKRKATRQSSSIDFE